MKEQHPIDVTGDWIVICLNDEHPTKQLSSILVKVDGIVICFNDEQPLNPLSPISVTKGGIVKSTKDEHPLKTLLFLYLNELLLFESSCIHKKQSYQCLSQMMELLLESMTSIVRKPSQICK